MEDLVLTTEIKRAGSIYEGGNISDGSNTEQSMKTFCKQSVVMLY
jgi:hypothetical protein